MAKKKEVATDNLEKFDLPVVEEVSNTLQDKIDDVDKQEEVIPSPGDTKWHEYVMRQFEEDELFDGRPTVDGLRRVTELIIGEIFESVAEVVKEPHFLDNGVISPTTVEYTVIIRRRSDGTCLTYRDVADVHHLNTVPEYLRFPTAMAATRAEGRALRKALKLRKMITAEEAEAPKVEEVEMNGKINDSQINFLKQLCKLNNLNLVKYVNSGSKTYKSIKEIPFDKAVVMVKTLSEFSTHYTKVPEDWVGYDPDWEKKPWASF